MPTILDSLSIELGWDLKKFFEGSKQVEQVARTQREDFERQSKIWEYGLDNLNRLLMKVTAAFLSIEAAMRLMDMSKTLSRTGTEFTNLAAAIGLSVEQLSMWEQALERVGGDKGSVGRTMKRQQQEMQAFDTGNAGAPSFLGQMQLLGMQDWRRYKDPRTGVYDMDRFNKDLFDALERDRRKMGQTLEQYAPRRQFLLEQFHWEGPAAQALFRERLREQLEATRATAPTRANLETFQRLNELWTQLGQTAESVYRNLITYLEQPITRILQALQRTTQEMNNFIKALEGSRYVGPFSVTPTWSNPLGLGRPIAVGPAPTERPGGPSWLPWPLGSFNPMDPEAWKSKTPGAPPSPPAPGPSAPAAPAAPVTPPGAYQTPFGTSPWPMPGTTTPAAPPGATFEERFNSLPGPHSSLDQLSSMTAMARAGHLAGAQPPPGSSVETTNNSQVTIGSMSFHSRASDTAMGHAPSNIDKDLSVGSYAVHANESLE